MSLVPNAQPGMANARDLSVPAQAAAGWFRRFSRVLKVFRLYRPDNPTVVQAHDGAAQALMELVTEHQGWELRFTPSAIFLDGETIVSAGKSSNANAGMFEQLPFIFYRDGVRRLSLLPKLPRAEVDVLFNSLRLATAGPNTSDDLVTLLWQANLQHIQLAAVPLEQTIFLHSRRGGGGGGAGSPRSHAYAIAPGGEEIHADLGQLAGAQGLHRDTFDDWELPDQDIDVPEAFSWLAPLGEMDVERLRAAWERERDEPWAATIPDVLRELYAIDPQPETRESLARATATWLVGALQGSAWAEAATALTLLREMDPDGASQAELAGMIAGLELDPIAERLDEAEADDQTRFTSLAVALGPPAIDLVCTVLAVATRSRTRAAATAALCYLCGDQPGLLATYLTDSRWFVVRNIVFVLGQIGGPEVVGLLRIAAEHPEPRVRRQVVQSLGSMPLAERVPILLAQLDTNDAQLLAASLAMLTRERNPGVARAILDRIEAPDFESRPEANRRALFTALAEIADDSAVPALEALLQRGGWFARRTMERTAAARTLMRLGSDKATKVLEAGLRSRVEAVRAACLDAMGSRHL